MNWGDYDSAAYVLRPMHVSNVWMDNFKRACQAARETGKAYYLLLAHRSVSRKHKYIGLLKGMLNYMSWADVEYLTCSELATRHIRRLTGCLASSKVTLQSD